MKKAEMLNDIEAMLKDASNALKFAKAQRVYLDPPWEDMNLMPYAMISKARVWLRKIWAKELVAYDRAWVLCKNEVWQRMFTYGGFDDHAEMKLLVAAGVELRRALGSKDRPDLFKKGKLRDEIRRLSKQSK